MKPKKIDILVKIDGKWYYFYTTEEWTQVKYALARFEQVYIKGARRLYICGYNDGKGFYFTSKMKVKGVIVKRQ